MSIPTIVSSAASLAVGQNDALQVYRRAGDGRPAGSRGAAPQASGLAAGVLADDTVLTPAGATPGAVTNAQTISTLARLLTRLASAPATLPASGAAAPPAAPAASASAGTASTNSATPLLASSATPGAAAGAVGRALGQAIGQAIAASGLFYESHLARWNAGDYALADLRREPQFAARLGGPDDLGPGGATGATPALVADGTTPLVRQQLASLETQTIVWQGQPWAGMAVRLEIQPDPPFEGGSDDRGAGQAEGRDNAGRPLVWITRVDLDLPRLGRIEALLALRGTTVALSLTSVAPHTATTLAARRGALEDALAQHGLQACGLAIAAQGA